MIENLNGSVHAPGKTWFYNAVKLAVGKKEQKAFEKPLVQIERLDYPQTEGGNSKKAAQV